MTHGWQSEPTDGQKGGCGSESLPRSLSLSPSPSLSLSLCVPMSLSLSLSIYIYIFNCSRHLQAEVHEVAEALKSQGEEYG